MAQHGRRTGPLGKGSPSAHGRQAPPNPRVMDYLRRATTLINSEQPDLAIPILEEALKIDPNNPDGLYFMGRSFMIKQHWPEALRYLRRAALKRPMHLDTLVCIAKSNDAIGETGKAENAMRDLIRAYPLSPRVITQHVHRLQTQGRAEEAYAFLEEKLNAGVESPELYGALAKICQVTKRNGEGIDAARRVIDDIDLPINARRSALFTLGLMLDAEGQYDDAFEAFRRANETMEAHPAVTTETFDLLWNEKRQEAMPVSSVTSELPVLVLGMPRSGTTITEQILAAHPEVETVGECDLLARLWGEVAGDNSLLDADRLGAAGQAYVDRLRTVATKQTTRVVDKMPENYFYLGFAEKIVPGARFVHCHRHPLDTCLSNYFQDFAENVLWSRRLDVIGDQYRTYTYAMERLLELVDSPVLDWPNEQLKADPQGQAVKLLDFVSLSHDDRSINFRGAGSSVRTASSAQVREGVSKSRGARWKNYEKHIGPLIEQIGDLVEAYEAKYAD